MPFMSWTSDLSVGVEAMDEQHKKLLGIVNQLHDAMKVGKGAGVLGPVLDSLISYTQSHFADEENFQRACRFPEHPQHKMLHAALTRQVLDIQQKFKTGKLIMTGEVLDFLRDWLLNHIKKCDKVYGDFARERGYGVADKTPAAAAR